MLLQERLHNAVIEVEINSILFFEKPLTKDSILNWLQNPVNKRAFIGIDIK